MISNPRRPNTPTCDDRHTHLSHLLRSGEPIMHVAARAGHGTPYQTLTTYAHVIPGDDERTARRAGEMFE
jgi:integrase